MSDDVGFFCAVTNARIDFRGQIVTAILRQVEDRGYIVKVFALNDTVEMHAVPVNSGEAQIVRCNDGDGDEEAFRAAFLLAEAVGIELEEE